MGPTTRAVAVVPGVGDGSGGDVDFLTQEGDVEVLGVGVGVEVGVLAAERVGAGLGADRGRLDRGLLERAADLRGNLGEDIDGGFGCVDAGRSRNERPFDRTRRFQGPEPVDKLPVLPVLAGLPIRQTARGVCRSDGGASQGVLVHVWIVSGHRRQITKILPVRRLLPGLGLHSLPFQSWMKPPSACAAETLRPKVIPIMPSPAIIFWRNGMASLSLGAQPYE